MDTIDYTIDHLEKVALMLYQFEENSPLLNNFNLAFLAESNTLEELFQQLMDERSLETATGVQLDQVGWLVGEDRKNRSDSAYRLGIKVRIAVNTSSGTVNDIIQVIQLLYGSGVDVIITRTAPATISLFLGIEQPTTDLKPLLQQTIAAGVEIDSIIYASDRQPWIPTERGGVITDTGILPEFGDETGNIRVPPERI